MEYKHVDGIVYSRYALTPPVINSELAREYGVQVPCPVEPGQFGGLEPGRNVKLRLVIERGTKKMTCHAQIDWVRIDEAAGRCMVGFGSLSLTDAEFHLLENNFAGEPVKPLEFVEQIKDKAPEAAPVLSTEKVEEIMRLKVVNFPVSVIEAVDAHRGNTSFSEFVTNAVRVFIKEKNQ